MKKSRIFMASGTLALAIAAIFATKANKRFTFGIKTAVGGDFVYANSTAVFTVSHGGTLVAAHAQLVTAAGSIISSPVALVTKNEKDAQLYIAP